MKRLVLIPLAVAAALVLGACSEKPQTTSASHRKADAQAWKGAADDPFVATGWTQGDQESWRKQIRQRNQYQNEYTRVQ
ncbi:hypothetical protein [Cupriavidus sp. AU9028]|uniref:hypothetical protein n=1 Tax=Cupriavidus sp. AU9028 TaxID=2871157 RepID=UPI001C9770D7|nr:hypothetical protein [Cupriavidus sp. AU9028]MBY4899301.1 hypothetical protein [Cupriavidus sp. AU9028]